MAKALSLTRDQVEMRLKQKGLQPTLQRVGIGQFVLCSDEHPTADEVHAWAEKNLGKVSLATVYNTLKSLVGVGLLREFRFGHSEKTVFDPNVEEHHHFVDERTGRLHDVPLHSISLKSQLGPEFRVKNYEILIKGIYQTKTKGR